LNQYTVKKYTENDYAIWNDFIDHAKNATFLFHRDFMEYHKDRFEDYSLLVFDGEKLVAVLPANVVSNEVFSHQGLTYGGLVYNQIKLIRVIEVFQSVLFFLNINNKQKLFFKAVPSIYHQNPADEILYAVFLAEGKLVRRDSLSVIDLSKPFVIKSGRKEGIKKAIKNKLRIVETDNLDSFWEEILVPNLNLKHKAIPVHSILEITNLKLLFPKKIRQFNVLSENKIIAGTTIFETETVAHCQYISKYENKDNSGCLDLLFHYLLKNIFKDKRFFDFGVSNENNGKKLNEGLSFWKESFGASTIIQDFYEIESSNYEKLNNIAI